MDLQAGSKCEANDNGDDRPTKFRILKIDGRKRAFSLEPVFWSILKDAASQSSMRLGDYVGSLLAGASNGNNSSLLRSRAAEWAADQAARLRDKGLVSLARRVAISHTSPAFVIDQDRKMVACNRPFEDMLAGGAAPSFQTRFPSMDLRLGVPMSELSRILKEHPEKFLRANFSARCGELERSGALNIMLIGDEKGRVLFLCLVRSVEEARRCA